MKLLNFYRTNDELKSAMVDAIDEILRRNKKLEEVNMELNRRLNEPTDEKLAQALQEIKRLEAEIKETRKNSLYILSDTDKERAVEFLVEHRKDCPRGRMRWVIIPTSVGTCLEYACSCGKKIDLTDW